MARQTRNSKPLEKAELRAKGLQSVNPQFDLGNGISLAAYNAAIAALREKVDSYNATIADLDQTQKEIQLAEEQLNDFSEHILLSVAAIYGKGSNEYALTGGKRKGSRRQTTRGNDSTPMMNLPPSLAQDAANSSAVLNGSNEKN